MYIVSKQFTFAMGHRLSCHEGLCKNFHGHNYTVEVGVRSEALNENGMVIDFGDLKKIVNDYLEKLDHALMINETDKEMVDKMGGTFNVITVPYEPTAENMAADIYFELDQIISKNGVFLDYVTIWETDKSKATYKE
jgi:6-pyruvoyltetrahydropterin/6-carboxytetrahydropterin synthase